MKQTEKQMTAVDWLINEFKSLGIYTSTLQNKCEQAKEMEKRQKEECWDVAHQAGRFEGKGIAQENWQTFEHYYNETFKSE